MRRAFVAVTAAALCAACRVEPEKPAPKVVIARFDPGNTPPVVPSPNDLAMKDGRINIAPENVANPTEVDKALIAYLNTLNGFPVASTAAVTFTAEIDETSVTPKGVRVLDITEGANNASATDVVLTYMKQPDNAAAPSRLAINGPGNLWKPGRTYAVAIIGGDSGLKGVEGEPVVGSPAWALMRSEKPLVDCEDLTSSTCRPTTNLIPTRSEDPAEQLAEQTRLAIQLEELRRKYKPSIDVLLAQGVKRQEIALLWTFKVTDMPSVVFIPAATPARVPVPNDLAINPATGLLEAPIDPRSSPAEQEFVRDYLNTLNGFPASSTAAVEISGGDLDPATVNAQTVRLMNLTPNDNSAPPPVEITFDPVRKRIVLTPPNRVWPKGKTYGVAVVADGDKGIKTTDGRVPIGSEVWALLRGRIPLTTCDDLSSSDCRSAITLVQVSAKDAVRLESIRRQYAKHLDAIERNDNIKREQVAVFWIFSITPNPEAFFDPANRVVPFPNDIIRAPATGTSPARLELPIPDDASQSAKDLFNRINQLDGFSTTATSISETSATRGVLEVGQLNAGTLTDPNGGIGFVKISAGGTAPQVTRCLNCTSTLLRDGSAPNSPQQLQFVPDVPLDEQSTYAAYITTDTKDSEGRNLIANPAFALLRATTPLADANGKSLVSLITDDQAKQLEPVRLRVKPMLDALADGGIPRKKVALAWGLTTQTIRAPLAELYQLPAARGVKTDVRYLYDDSATYLSPANAYPKDRIGKVFVGKLTLLDTLVGSGGTADPANAKPVEAPFFLTTPITPAPSSGYPVVIWGHPFTASRISLLAIANALANKGYALLSIDLPRHGERTTCVGSRLSVALGGNAQTDDKACRDEATQGCEPTTGRCVAKNAGTRLSCTYDQTNPLLPPGDVTCARQFQGDCLPTNVCEGGTFAEDAATRAPLISGWNFISASFFGTRDNFRQWVVDVAQLERVIAGSGPASFNGRLGSGSGLDKDRIHYVGMSLGGMTGALAASVSPNLRKVVLNATGADVPSLLLNGLTPAARDSFLNNLEQNGLYKGTPTFDQFIDLLRLVLDPGDPANHALYMHTGPSDRRVMIQYITNDPVMPNANTARLIAAANRAGGPQATIVVEDRFPSITGTPRHSYLINQDTANNQTLRNTAQSQVVNFLDTGAP